VNKHVTFRYTFIGIVFGILFPIISIVLILFLQHLPLTQTSLIYVHKIYPFIYLIYIVPFLMVLCAGIIGNRQSQFIMLKEELKQQQHNNSELLNQLNAIQANLEQRVAERTQGLKTAAEVAREASAIRDLNLLLTRTTQLISDHFGFYHAGIFLIDEIGEYAILKAANSEGGQGMLARGHKLKVGQIGIVGHVASAGEPRIAVDVGTDATYFNNPDLPLTRSEMAMPLKVHGRVIGVLDVQSTEAGAFTADDVEVLQIMADQIALAIENARLIETSQRVIHELETISGQQARLAWRQRLGSRPRAYVYNRLGVEPVSSPLNEGEWALQQPTSLPEQETYKLAVPITVRDQLLGSVILQRDAEQQPWQPEDHITLEKAVSQIAQALENARLMEEIRQRAQYERLIGQISTRTQSSLDIKSVMKSAVQELGQALDLAKVQIRLENKEKPIISQ